MGCLTLFALLAVQTTLCWAALYENVADLTRLELKFDFIIVGGGTAGNVIANRLSENLNHSILVLEAGGSNAGVLDIIVPFYCTRATPNTPQDWNYTTTPQENLNGRVIPYPRGFVLGGSSSVNYMAYTRGSKEDYDRFAKVTGDEGWSWDRLIPYTRKNERFAPPADHHNTTGQFNPAVHGFNGINTVTLSGFPSPIDSRVIGITNEIDGFPFNLDMNSGYHLGIGWIQETVKDGSRSSSATSYLAPQFINRPNLHVLLHAHVTRVLQSGSNSTFRTVEFVHNLQNKRYILTAKKEVVLSAGSIGTPNILLHSGIGNASALSSLGIEPLHNLPSVGQNLTDHSLVALGWLVNSNNTYETAERNATLAAEQLAQWNATRTGPLVDNPGSQFGWLRIPDNSSIFEHFPDPASGPNTAHYELLFANGLFGPAPPTGNFLGIAAAVVSPVSRGSVTLNSNDPLAPPVINPNFFSSELDLFIMREGIRSALRFAAAPAWEGYVISPVGINSTSTDAEVDEYTRNNAGTVDHVAGTASMSRKGAPYGVVDPDLRVKGLTGLRIVDLSVVPFIPAGHTQAPTYIIAEKGADLIKEAWN
ncbi:aryl-alcohol-oxidase from pleurotus Eryingii [Mycena capillaripes]|nr:aryl-alcohol-oxidase from pleurotus Eryingii [Mycena capillaripes]